MQGVSPPLLAPSVRAHRAASACDSIHNGASMIHLPPLKMASTNAMGRYRLGDVPAIPRRWGPKAAGLTTGVFVRSNYSGVTHCVSCLYSGVSVDCSFCRRSWDRYRVSTSSLGYVAQDATTISGFFRDINSVVLDYLGNFGTFTSLVGCVPETNDVALLPTPRVKLLPSKKARAKLAAKSRRLLLRVIRLEEEQVARALRKLAKKGRRVAAKVIARAWKQSLLLRKVYPPPPPKLYISPVRRVLAKVFKPVVTVGIPVPKTFPRDEQASPYRLRERSPARFYHNDNRRFWKRHTGVTSSSTLASSFLVDASAVVTLDGPPELADSDDESDDEPRVVAAAVGDYPAASHLAEGCTEAVVLMLHTTSTVLNIAGVDPARVLVDGGATIHATSSEHLCFDITPCSVSIAGVGGVAFSCRKRGKLIFQPADRVAAIILTDVHIAPEFPTTFISESALVRKGCSVLKNSSGGQVSSDATGLMFKLEENDGLYYAVGSLCLPPLAHGLRSSSLPDTPFDCNDVPAALCWLAKCDLTNDGDEKDEPHSLLLAKTYSKREVSDLLGRYHRRMSHISFKRVAAAFGIALPANFEPPLCTACVIGKQKNIPHHEGARLRATRPCAGLHIDFCGPFPHTSRYGSRYLLIFKCDYTGFVWDFYTKAQSEFFDIFVGLVARLSNQFSLINVVIWIRSDNGKVLLRVALLTFV